MDVVRLACSWAGNVRRCFNTHWGKESSDEEVQALKLYSEIEKREQRDNDIQKISIDKISSNKNNLIFKKSKTMNKVTYYDNNATRDLTNKKNLEKAR